MKQQLTNDPAVLVGLVLNTRYSIQNQSTNRLYIQHSDSVPVGVSDAFDIAPKAFGIVRKTTGHELYVWSNFSLSVSPGSVVYDEAA